MYSMNPRVVKTNIKAFKPLADANLGFGRKMDIARELKNWKTDARTKRAWISQKRRSITTALKEFRDLCGAKEYYAEFGKNDDSFEVFYRPSLSA